MELGQGVLFFFSLLGVFNGFLFSIYFLFLDKKNELSRRILGVLLLALCVRLSKNVLQFFDISQFGLISHPGAMACLSVGPLLFLYISASAGKIDRLKWKHFLHFILVIGLPLYFAFIEMGYHSPGSTAELPYIAFNFQRFCYLIASGMIMIELVRGSKLPVKKLLKKEVWSISIFSSVFLLWLTNVTLFFTTYVAGAVVFSFLLYFFVLIVYTNKGKKNNSKKPLTNNYDQANNITSDLVDLLKNKKVFKNKNIKMPEIATQLNITPHQFSEFLNTSLNKNFSNFINEYRIKEAKDLLLDESNYTIECIAELSGFKSTSAFYSAFKIQTGSTPKAYKKLMVAN